MNEQRAREVLGDIIQPDGSLYCIGHYIAWTKGDTSVCLDCNFDADELEAIVWWMQNVK